MLYTSLTGKLPFDTDQDDPPVPSAIVSEIPKEIDSIVMKAMAPRRTRRYELNPATPGTLYAEHVKLPYIIQIPKGSRYGDFHHSARTIPGKEEL